MPRYIALIDGEAGAHGGVFPEAPGCTAMGVTLDEALRNAGEAIAEWVSDEEAAGRAAPVARPVEAIRADPEVAEAVAEGAVLTVVPLVVDSGRPARVNVSLDAGLLAAIDEAAAARGLTRSAFLGSAAREKIAAG